MGSNLFYFSCAGQGRESSEEFEIMFRKYEMDGWTIGRSEMNWARYKKNIFLWRMGIWFFGVWMVHWPALLCFFYFPRFATREFRLVCCLVAFMSYGWPAIFDSWVVWFTWYANIFEGRELWRWALWYHSMRLADFYVMENREALDWTGLWAIGANGNDCMG